MCLIFQIPSWVTSILNAEWLSCLGRLSTRYFEEQRQAPRQSPTNWEGRLRRDSDAGESVGRRENRDHELVERDLPSTHTQTRLRQNGRRAQHPERTKHSTCFREGHAQQLRRRSHPRGNGPAS